jgi:hypothetical protein
MIGLDFPLKPEWIYETNQLWEPKQSIPDLVNKGITQTMQELGGEKTRRNTLSIILRIFFESEGSRNNRQTVDHDIWPSYSKIFSTNSILPAYLVHIISTSEVAQEATSFISHRFTPGSIIKSEELRRYLISKYGERKVVLNTGSAFLKTLQYFGILEVGNKYGEYFYCCRVKPSIDIFPLLVWSLWKKKPMPQIDLDLFMNQIEFSFLDIPDWESNWKAYQPNLWVISERVGAHNATLKSPEIMAFKNQLLGLLDI